MTDELLAVIILRRLGVAVPDGMEADAVASQAVRRWHCYEYAQELIDEHCLSCTLEDVERAILARCQRLSGEHPKEVHHGQSE
jgi:hypothetical protein